MADRKEIMEELRQEIEELEKKIEDRSFCVNL